MGLDGFGLVFQTVSQVCGSQHQTGFLANGCFAEYTIAEANYVGRVPDNVSFAQSAPILCAGVTTYKALKETEAKPGQWVAIIGACGGLGHVGGETRCWGHVLKNDLVMKGHKTSLSLTVSWGAMTWQVVNMRRPWASRFVQSTLDLRRRVMLLTP